MFKVSVDGGDPIELSYAGQQLQLGQEDLLWDLEVLAPGRFHILYEQRSYLAEVVDVDYEEKVFKLKINGGVYEAAVQDRFDLLLERLGMSNMAAAQVNELKAPMPGLILDIKVAAGDMVQKGDAVLVLEAMKMENVLKAPGDGTVQEVLVQQGSSVEKNQVLIRF